MQQHFILFDDLRVQRRVPDETAVRVIRGNEPERPWDPHTDGKLEDCCFKQIMTNTDVIKELHTSKLLRSIPAVHNILAMHPSVDAIKISGFYYAVFYNKDVVPLISLKNESDDVIEKLVIAYTLALKLMHDNNLIHGFVNDTLLNGTISKSCVTPLIKYNSHCKTYVSFKAEKQYSESPYVAPLQIILEMMNSSIEPTLIEYKGFKDKFIKFWTHLGYRSCAKNLPKISQDLFGESYGALDFIDYVLQRYCLFDNGYIIKDNSKAFGYLKDIDLFGLAITVQSILGDQTYIAPRLKKILGECVAGNWICIDHHCEFENVKLLSIPERPLTITPMPTTIQLKDGDAKISPSKPLDEDCHSSQHHDTTKTIKVAPEPTALLKQSYQEIIDQPKNLQDTSEVNTQPIIKSNDIIDVNNNIKAHTLVKSKDISGELPKNTPAPEPRLCKFKNDQSLIGELMGTGIKKVKVGGVERIVRMESDGEYIIWKGCKLYLA